MCTFARQVDKLIAARDGKGAAPGLIGADELKAIFGVFDVPRTGVISLSQYKEGGSLPRVHATPRVEHSHLKTSVPAHAAACQLLTLLPTRHTFSCIVRRPTAMKAAGVPPGLYSEKPAGFLMGTGGRIKADTFVDEG